MAPGAALIAGTWEHISTVRRTDHVLSISTPKSWLSVLTCLTATLK